MLVRARHVGQVAGHHRARVTGDHALCGQLIAGRPGEMKRRRPGDESRRGDGRAKLKPLRPCGDQRARGPPLAAPRRLRRGAAARNLRADALRQAGRCAMVRGVRADSLAKRGEARDLGSTCIAGIEMPLELQCRIDDALGILFLETALDGAAVVARVAIRARVEGCLVERNAARRYLVALEPRVIRIAHDAEQPCAAVLAFEAVEEAEGAQKRFLRHVLGIALIARQPAREVVGRIQVRGEEHLETLNPACLVQAQGLLWALGVGRRRRPAGKRIYASHPPNTGRGGSLFPGISVRRSRYIASNTHLSKETGMPSTINRRQFLQLAGLGSVGVVFASALPGVASAAGSEDFYFVQLSDTHWGFEGPPNPDAKGTLRKAVASVNALAQQPDFIVFTGDLTHTTDNPVERRKRMSEFREIVADLRAKDVRFMPGEHDASLDYGKAYKEFFGATYYTFDHKGVHFIA